MQQEQDSLTIAIQGVKGCFHEMAARKFYGPNIGIHECHTFKTLCQAVANEQVDFGIMAIENTIAGTLLPNYALLQEHQLRIRGEVYLNIQMNLMALPGVTLDDLEQVHSHPIANRQCAEFLSTLAHVEIVDKEDTALAAKHIQAAQLRTVAAVGNSYTAELYGLNILKKRIETHQQNFTRFLIVGNAPIHEPTNNKASLSFQLGHTPGSLADTLAMFKDAHLNLTKIQSVPIVGKPYEYTFHVDLEWNKREDFDAAIRNILDHVSRLTVLGEYQKGIYELNNETA